MNSKRFVSVLIALCLVGVAVITPTQQVVSATPSLPIYPWDPFVYAASDGLRVASSSIPTVDGVVLTQTVSPGVYVYPTVGGVFTVSTVSESEKQIRVEFTKLLDGEIYSDDAITLTASSTSPATLVRYINHPGLAGGGSGRIYATWGYSFTYQERWIDGLFTSWWNSGLWDVNPQWSEYTTLKVAGHDVCSRTGQKILMLTSFYGLWDGQLIGVCGGVQDEGGGFFHIYVGGELVIHKVDDLGRFNFIGQVPSQTEMPVKVVVLGYKSRLEGTLYKIPPTESLAGILQFTSGELTTLVVQYTFKVLYSPISTDYTNMRDKYSVSGAGYTTAFDWRQYNLQGVCDSGWCDTITWDRFTNLRLNQHHWLVFAPIIVRH